jgi:lipopolysaccharide exporter
MGIWTLGFALIGVFQIFRDFGTATYIQTAKELSNDEIRICNGLQLIVGLFFFVCFLVAAKPMAAFYREPRVAEVIYVLSLGFIIMPLSSTSFNLLLRDGRFALKSGIDFTAQIVIYLGGVGLAYFGASHLSAPIAVIIAQALVVLLCWRYRNPLYSLGYKFSDVGKVAKLSGTALSVSIVQHAADKSPDFILPKTQGFALSSIYEKGVNCLELVRMAVVELIGSVLVNSLRIRTKDAPEKFPALAANTLVSMLIFAVLGAAFLAINAESFLLTLFGKQWIQAKSSLEILAIATPFVCMTAFLTKVMYLREMHAQVLKIAMICRVAMIGIVLALAQASIETLAKGVVGAEIAFAFVYIYLNRANVDWKDILKPLMIDTILCIGIVKAAHLGIAQLHLQSNLLAVILNGSACGVLVVAVFFLLRRSTIQRVRHCLNI